MENINIQTYRAEYAGAVADLFTAAVHAIDTSIYDNKQKAVWAPTPPDYEYWARRLEHKRPWLAVINGRVAGFIELDADGYIDCTYVHPDFQHRGVATALYRRLETEALAQGMERLYVDASLVANPFFVHFGFKVIKENRVIRNGVSLANFTMEKWIDTGRGRKR